MLILKNFLTLDLKCLPQEKWSKMEKTDFLVFLLKKNPQISIPSARATARALPSLPHIKFLLSLAKDEAVFLRFERPSTRYDKPKTVRFAAFFVPSNRPLIVLPGRLR